MKAILWAESERVQSYAFFSPRDYCNVRILKYWTTGMRYSIIPLFSDSVGFFLSNFHHQIRIIVDGSAEPRRDQRCGEGKLDDRGTFDARGSAEKRIVVDRSLDELPIRPGEKNFSFTLPGGRDLRFCL